MRDGPSIHTEIWIYDTNMLTKYYLIVYSGIGSKLSLTSDACWLSDEATTLSPNKVLSFLTGMVSYYVIISPLSYVYWTSTLCFSAFTTKLVLALDLLVSHLNTMFISICIISHRDMHQALWQASQSHAGAEPTTQWPVLMWYTPM